MEKKLKYQQGDVLLYIAEIPTDCKPVQKTARGYVLAEGEATGHAHRIADPTDLKTKSVGGVEMFRAEDGTLYMSVIEASPLIHEEHGTIIVDPGTYEIGRVREVDPFENEIHSVRD